MCRDNINTADDIIVRISPLPPLDNLVAFEAASRHKSFTRAAKELNITQSAVSRRVLQLEEFIGRALFVRGVRTLQLTITGQRYVEQIQKLLNNMSDVTRDVMKSDSPMSLTIACASGTSSLWLAPRLSDFIHRHPNIKTRVVVREGLSNLAPSECGYYLVWPSDHPESSPVRYFKKWVLEQVETPQPLWEMSSVFTTAFKITNS